MQKYVIAESVSLIPRPSPIPKPIDDLFKTIAYPLANVPFGQEISPELVAGKIETSRDLKHFTSYTGRPWQHGVKYVEHPMIKGVLIPEKEFCGLMLREIVSDISGYILDNFTVEDFTFGIVKSFGGKFGASVAVGDVCANANLKLKIYKGFYFHITNTTVTAKRQKYIWIDQFPEIKTAVRYKAATMEEIARTGFNFIAELGLTEFLGVKSSAGKNLEFYINYIKSK